MEVVAGLALDLKLGIKQISVKGLLFHAKVGMP